MNAYDLIDQLQQQPLTGGMQRRPMGAAAPEEAQINDAPSFTTPDTGETQFLRGLGSGATNIGADYHTGKGVVQSLFGNTAGAAASFARAKEMQQQAAQYGPSITSVKDIHSASDVGDYAAGLLGQSAPDLAMMATGGGVAASIGKRMVRKGIERTAEDMGAKMAEKAAADGVIDATPAAKAEFTADKAAELAPRLAARQSAQTAMETAEKVGHAVGTTAGAYPGALGSMNDVLANSKPEDYAGNATKAAIGSLGVAALAAAPVNRLLGRWGKPLAEDTAKFIPRVAAEVAKQGGTMGALGVASTAATLATHKWINNNLDVISPQTFDQYLDSFVGGALLGGVLGGGVEALRSGAQGAAHAGAGFMDKAMKRVRNLYVDDEHATDPGELPPDGGTPPETPSGTPPGTEGIDVNENDVSAHEAFKAHMDSLGRMDELQGLDEKVKKVVSDADTAWQKIQSGQEQPIAGEPASRPLPGFKTKLQGILAAFIPVDHPLRGDLDAVKPLVASAEKLFHVEPNLDDADRNNLSILSRAVGDETVQRWAALGPEYAKGVETANKVEDSKAPPNPAFEDELQKAIDEHEQQKAEAAKVANTETSDQSELDDHPATATGEESQAAPDLGYQVGKLPDTDLRDRLTAAEKDSPEQQALQGELQRRLFKEGAPFIEQKTGGGSAAFNRFLAREGKSASSVEVDPVQQKDGPARRFVQLNTLVSNEIARTGGGIAPHDALMNVFGDLKLAGLKVKPESVKAGKVWESKDGTQVARLTPSDKISIQRGLTGQKLTPSLAAHTRDLSLRDAIRESMKRQGKPVNEGWLKTVKAEAPHPEWIKEILRQVDTSNRERGLDREHGKETEKHAGADTITRTRTGTAIERNERPSSDEEVGVKGDSEVHVLKARKSSGAELKGKEADQPDKVGAPENIAAAEKHAALAEKAAKSNTGKKPDAAKPEDAVERGVSRTEAEAAKTDAEARPGETVKVQPRGGKPQPKVIKTSVGNRKVVRTYDVPLLGSSLKDGTVVIDRSWVGKIKDGLLKGLDRTPFLVEHEAVERNHENAGKSYTDAHRLATDAEHAMLLKHLGLEKGTKAADRAIEAYEKSYKPELKEAAQKQNPNTPPDMLEKPYEHPHNVEQRRLLAEVDKNEAGRTDDKIINQHAQETADPNRRPQIHKETDMLNRMIERLGLKGKIAPVRVEHLPSELTHKKRGDYNEDGTIRINQTLKGPVRLETMAHELGHHIVFQLLGKALEPKKVLGLKGAELDAAKKHNELLAALKADHASWRAQYEKDHPSGKLPKDGVSVTEVEASKKAYFSAEDRVKNDGGRTMMDVLSDDKRNGTNNYEYILSTHEWLADHISRELTSHEAGRGVVGEFFKGIADKLKQVYNTLFGTEEGKKYEAAPSVKQWIGNMFDTTAFKEKPSIVGFRKFESLFNAYMNKSTRRILYRALERGTIESKLNEKYGDVRTLKTVMENDDTRLAALTYLAMHEMQAGRLKLGPAWREPIRSMGDILHKASGISGSNELATRLIGDIRSGKVESTPGYDVHQEDLRTKTEKKQALQRMFNTLDEKYRKVVARVVTPIYWGAHDRIIRTQIPALLKAAALVRLHSSAPGKEGEHDMMHDRLQNTQKFLDKVISAFNGLSKEESKSLMDALQMQKATHDNPKIAEAMAKIQEQAKDWYKYASDKGIKMGETKNYFPVSMNPDEVASRRGEFEALIDKHMDMARHKMQMEDAPAADVKRAFYEAATGTGADDGMPDWKAPAFTAKNNRLLDFIYKSGDQESIEKLASFQKKDPADVIVPYIQQLTNRAEFAHRFGQNGEKLEGMLEQARKQGADDYDLRMTRDFINSAVGHYGAAGDRLWERFSKGLGGKFDEQGQPLNTSAKVASSFYSDKAQKTYDALMTFQNLNKLPLALLSSMSDIMGPFVRSGGDFHGIYTGLKEGLLALKKNRPSQLKDLARALHISEDYLNLDSLRNNYGGGDASSKARWLNDKMFKWNGLTGWSKALRYMALSVGQGFLLRHAANYSPKHSARYLFELGVKPEDIKRGSKPGTIKLLTEDQRESESTTPEELARDDRVRKALFRFTEQSILRTDVAQHPSWMNDPLMKVFAQYKQFGYAIESQIIDRMWHEVKYYKNYKVLLPFMAYAPITMMAEMMRSAIQYPGGNNPNREDWGPGKELAWGAQRSGIYGPKAEAAINSMFGANPAAENRGPFDLSQYGPTAQTASQLLDTLRGQRGLGTEAKSLAPGAPLYSKWHMPRKGNETEAETSL